MDTQKDKATQRPWQLARQGGYKILALREDNTVFCVAKTNIENCGCNTENASLIVKAVNNHDSLMFYAKSFLKHLEKHDPNSVTMIEGLTNLINQATK